jgi:hypothetical protein
VLCLEHDADAPGLELLAKPAGDLGRKPLLDLHRAREEVDHPSELGEPEDPLARQVANMGDPDERKQMVLAEGVKGDRARYNQLVVATVIGEARGIDSAGVSSSL